jgi:hypothetical protein
VEVTEVVAEVSVTCEAVPKAELLTTMVGVILVVVDEFLTSSSAMV